MGNAKPVVIYIEDQDRFDPKGYGFNYYDHIKYLIEECGFAVVHAHDYLKVAQVLRDHPEAVGIISDIDTHTNGAGLSWFEKYHGEPDALPVVFASNMLSYEHRAMALGAVDFVRKPFFETGDVMHPERHEEEAGFKQALTAALDKLKDQIERPVIATGRFS